MTSTSFIANRRRRRHKRKHQTQDDDNEKKVQDQRRIARLEQELAKQRRRADELQRRHQQELEAVKRQLDFVESRVASPRMREVARQYPIARKDQELEDCLAIQAQDDALSRQEAAEARWREEREERNYLSTLAQEMEQDMHQEEGEVLGQLRTSQQEADRLWLHESETVGLLYQQERQAYLDQLQLLESFGQEQEGKRLEEIKVLDDVEQETERLCQLEQDNVAHLLGQENLTFPAEEHVSVELDVHVEEMTYLEEVEARNQLEQVFELLLQCETENCSPFRHSTEVDTSNQSRKKRQGSAPGRNAGS